MVCNYSFMLDLNGGLANRYMSPFRGTGIGGCVVVGTPKIHTLRDRSPLYVDSNELTSHWSKDMDDELHPTKQWVWLFIHALFSVNLWSCHGADSINTTIKILKINYNKQGIGSRKEKKNVVYFAYICKSNQTKPPHPTLCNYASFCRNFSQSIQYIIWPIWFTESCFL